MNKGELLDSSLESKVALREIESGYEVQTPSYSLRVHEGSPYIDLLDKDGAPWAQLYKGSDISTEAGADVTYAFNPPQVTRLNNGDVVIEIVSDTERESAKKQTWVCHNDFIETYITAKTENGLQNIRLLGGTTVEPNVFGLSMSQRHFESVFNPQPSELERPVNSALESTHITTSGMWKPGRRREFLLTPFSYGFNRSAPAGNGELPDGPWLMASISAPIEAQNSTQYSYNAVEDGFSLSLAYDTTDELSPTFTSPSLLLHFAPHPLQGLEDFKMHATALGHLHEPLVSTAPWHRGTTFVTWGHQLEHERRLKQQGHAVAARDLITEPFVIDALQTLEKHNVHINKVVLDDKWQAEYGTNLPDTQKWPDMARFTHTQHEMGRHVLLWIKLFDPEGLPPELCILDARGRPIASDPTNPNYLELLRDQVHTMLSDNHLGADGLKLDFLAQLPHGPGLRWHGTKRGHAALHGVMKNVYDEALTTKNDALIEAQMVSPWFANTFNQVRLNDTNERHPVVRTMGQRASLALTLLPNHPIDPDGWPMRDLHSWREYIQAQPSLTGTITTHFVDSVNGVPLTSKEYETLAEISRRKAANS
jgi:hypothetical protein